MEYIVEQTFRVIEQPFAEHVRDLATNHDGDTHRLRMLADAEQDDPEVVLEPPAPEQVFEETLHRLVACIGAMRFDEAADQCRRLAILHRHIQRMAP